jgi:hypothetical protein
MFKSNKWLILLIDVDLCQDWREYQSSHLLGKDQFGQPRSSGKYEETTKMQVSKQEDCHRDIINFFSRVLIYFWLVDDAPIGWFECKMCVLRYYHCIITLLVQFFEENTIVVICLEKTNLVNQEVVENMRK